MGSPFTTRLALFAVATCLLPSPAGVPAQTARRRAQPQTTVGARGSAAKASPALQSWDENRSWFDFTAEVTGGNSPVLDSLRQLLDSGLSPNAKDKYGNTALHAAATAGAAPVVRYLLSRGADPDARDSSGRTPLMLSASLGGMDPFKESSLPVWSLLWAEPMCDSEGSPAVLRFARQALDWYELAKKQRETLRLLLDAGADVNAVDGEGRGVLDYAVLSGLTDFDDLIRRSGKLAGQPTCALTTGQAPALRGFRLGMALGEALARFRAFNLPARNSCGRLSLDFNVWDAPVDSFARVPAEFDGVIGLKLAFLDDRLAYVRVIYEKGTGGRTPAEFRATTIERLSLPGRWRPLSEFSMEQTQVIGCDGFKVMAGYRGGPYVELYDTAAAQTLLQRRAAEEERRRREEETEQERRRKSYKP
jgi:Ankyrin repeats (many copies)